MTESRPQRTLLTPQEVAEWLGVNVQGLADWRYRNVGPAFTRIGRSIRYERDQVEKFIAAGRVQTAA